MSQENIAEIRRRLASFEAAYNSEDLDGVLSAWAADFVDMPDGLATLRGAEARARRQAGVSERFRDYESRLSVEAEEIAPLGEAAVLVRGRLTVTMRHRRTDAVSSLRRRFMEVWVRDPAGWAIQFEMGNNEP